MITTITYKGKQYNTDEEYGLVLATEYTYKLLLEKGHKPKKAKELTSKIIKENGDNMFGYHGY